MFHLTKEEIDNFLGSPPWDIGKLRKCYFRDFQKTHEIIKNLHGGILFNEIKSLRLSLNIFLNAIDDLITSINKFKYESAHPVFWHKINRPFADKIEVTIQRGILSSDICAMALVEHSRKFNKKYPVAGYEREIKRFFHNNEQHRFIHGLRRFITHVKFTKANWEISYSKDEGRNVFFILPKNDLLEFKDWNSLARSFILKHEKGIDVENLFDVYSGEVRKFHNWLRVSLLNKYGDIISEYLRYLRVIKGFDSENYWNILIHQVIPQKNIDPYIYLDQYLTEDELEDVFSLPYRSKEQVDRIIELVDSYKICNDSMRKDIYEICKVKET